MCESLRMPSSDEPMFLTAAEVCEFLQIDRSTLLRWVASGKVRAAQKLPGKSGAYLFDPAEVTRFMVARARAG